MLSSQRILIVEFDYAGDEGDYELDAIRLARPLGNVEGMDWKIWLSNTSNGAYGCVYLFNSIESMNAFIDGPISAQIDRLPQFQNVRMKSYDIMKAPSLLTRAPIGNASPEVRAG